MPSERTRRILLYPNGVNYKKLIFKRDEILTLSSKGLTLVPETETLNYEERCKELPVPIFCDIFSSFSQQSHPYSHPDLSVAFGFVTASVNLFWGTKDEETSQPDGTLSSSGFRLPIKGTEGNGVTTLATSFSGKSYGLQIDNKLKHNALSVTLESSSSVDLVGGHPDDTLIVCLGFYKLKLDV